MSGVDSGRGGMGGDVVIVVSDVVNRSVVVVERVGTVAVVTDCCRHADPWALFFKGRL